MWCVELMLELWCDVMANLWLDEMWHMTTAYGWPKDHSKSMTTDDPRTTEMLEKRCEMLEKYGQHMTTDDHRNMVNNWVQNKMKDVKNKMKDDRKCRYFLGNKCLRNKIWEIRFEK